MSFLDNLNYKKIGVIGIGYIGSNLVSFIKQNIPRANLIELKRDNYKQIIEEETFDYFINSAGNSGDFRFNILKTIESNIILTSFLLKNLKVRYNYLFLSSTRIYGFSKKKTKFKEDYHDKKNSLSLDFIYDGTKMLTECILLNYEKTSFNKIIVRLSNVYGNFNNDDTSTLIKKIVKTKGKSISVDINPSSSKDYIYITDAIDGILRALILSKGDAIYNIASGNSYSLNDIAKITNRIFHCNDKKNEIHSSINVNKAQTELGFYAKIMFKNGLLKTLEETD